MIALAEYSQTSTHLPGVSLIICQFFLHHYVMAKLATSSMRVNNYLPPSTEVNHKQPLMAWLVPPAKPYYSSKEPIAPVALIESAAHGPNGYDTCFTPDTC